MTRLPAPMDSSVPRVGVDRISTVPPRGLSALAHAEEPEDRARQSPETLPVGTRRSHATWRFHGPAGVV